MNRRERDRLRERARLDDEIATMLQAGATHEDIVHTLHVGHSRVRRVRAERQIPVPPGRCRLDPAERRAREERATDMLRAGATYQQIYDATRLQKARISALRKQHRIPVPSRPTTPATPAPACDLDTLYDAIFNPGATP